MYENGLNTDNGMVKYFENKIGTLFAHAIEKSHVSIMVIFPCDILLLIPFPIACSGACKHDIN